MSTLQDDLRGLAVEFAIDDSTRFADRVLECIAARLSISLDKKSSHPPNNPLSGVDGSVASTASGSASETRKRSETPLASALTGPTGAGSESETAVTDSAAVAATTLAGRGASRRVKYSEDFESFWSKYSKGSKYSAFQEWQKLSIDERAACHLALEWQAQTSDWQKSASLTNKECKDFRLDTERWIKRRRFEDQPPQKAKPYALLSASEKLQQDPRTAASQKLLWRQKRLGELIEKERVVGLTEAEHAEAARIESGGI